mmetsp:Transcript_21218/g.57131  ORF Transcript_21218/g.57131 Transcript_21218/m.57131 type:complete len:214 (-) Transcript_21218:2017-2658(-)
MRFLCEGDTRRLLLLVDPFWHPGDDLEDDEASESEDVLPDKGNKDAPPPPQVRFVAVVVPVVGVRWVLNVLGPVEEHFGGARGDCGKGDHHRDGCPDGEDHTGLPRANAARLLGNDPAKSLVNLEEVRAQLDLVVDVAGDGRERPDDGVGDDVADEQDHVIVIVLRGEGSEGALVKALDDGLCRLLLRSGFLVGVDSPADGGYKGLHCLELGT